MSDKLTITTNRIPRDMVAFFQLPAKEMQYFDYIKEDDQYQPRLVEYKGCWYDVYDTMNVGHIEAFQGWDSYISDTFFSGVLFLLMRDGDDERVICGRYYA
jgi:hypothetical protein